MSLYCQLRPRDRYRQHALVRPSLVAVAGVPAAGLAPLLKNFLLTLTLENFLAPARPEPVDRGGVDVLDSGVGGRIADDDTDIVLTRGEPSVSVCSLSSEAGSCPSLSPFPLCSASSPSTCTPLPAASTVASARPSSSTCGCSGVSTFSFPDATSPPPPTDVSSSDSPIPCPCSLGDCLL